MSLDFKLRRALAGVSYPPRPGFRSGWRRSNHVTIGYLFEEPLRIEDLYEEAIDGLGRAGPEASSIARWSSSPPSTFRTIS